MISEHDVQIEYVCVNKLFFVYITMEDSNFINTSVFFTRLQDLRTRAGAHEVAHSELLLLNKLLGFPLIACSVFLTSTLGLSLGELSSPYTSRVAGFVMSLTVSLIISAEKYYRIAEKTSSHDVSAKLLKDLIRDLEDVSSNPSLAQRRYVFDKVMHQLSVIEKYEEPVSDRQKRKAKGYEVKEIPQGAVLPHLENLARMMIAIPENNEIHIDNNTHIINIHATGRSLDEKDHDNFVNANFVDNYPGEALCIEEKNNDD